MQKIFDCGDLDKFSRKVIEVYNFGGISNAVFCLCEIKSGGRRVRFLTKLAFYRKYAPEIFGAVKPNRIDPVDNEIAILDILRRRFIECGVTPCLIEMVHYHKCSTRRLTPVKEKCKDVIQGDTILHGTPREKIAAAFCNNHYMTQAGISTPRCAFIVLEQCDITLDDYLLGLGEGPVALMTLRSVLFQLLYTLAAIRRVYPKFSHGDLHARNIMLKYYHVATPGVLKFVVQDGNRSGTKYFVPYFGIIPKIIDFGFAAIPEEGLMPTILDDPIANYYRTDDVSMLLHTLHKSFGDTKSGRDLDTILAQLDPSGTFKKYNPARIRDTEPRDPQDLLRTFSDYRVKKPGVIFTYKM